MENQWVDGLQLGVLYCAIIEMGDCVAALPASVAGGHGRIRAWGCQGRLSLDRFFYDTILWHARRERSLKRG
jgi:hypothetical protein